MKVYVSYEAYKKMVLAAKYAAPYEIAGLLYGSIDGKIVVEDADVFKIQSVTSASVNVEPEEFAKHVAGLSKEQVEKVIGFWHSHGNMKAFHSAIDVETSNILARQINPLITLTTNSKGELEAIIYVYVDKFDEVFQIEAEAELMMGDDDGLKKLITKLKKRLEKKRKRKAKKVVTEEYVPLWDYDEQEWRRIWREQRRLW